MILECLGIANVARQDIEGLVAAHGLHFPDCGGGCRRPGHESGAKAMPAKFHGVEASRGGVACHQVGNVQPLSPSSDTRPALLIERNSGPP
jgi:hypothetical protein